jgi:DMSO/TMAO reductase YedYZ molybdopterin-dependent catalytic subunit
VRRHTLLSGMGLGVFTGVVVLSVLYFGERVAGLPYVPFVLFEWLTRILPGALITFGIETMVTVITGLGVGPTSAVAKMAEMTLAVFLMLGGAGLFGLALAPRRLPRRVLAGVAGGALLFLLTLLAMLQTGGLGPHPFVSLVWLMAVLLGWGALLGFAIERAAVPEAAGGAAPGRRHFLASFLGAGAALFLAAIGLGRWRSGRQGASPRGTGVPLGPEATSGPAASPSPEVLAHRTVSAPGTRPELTPVERFYRIDIDLAPPRVDAASWRLRVDGLVGQPQALSLDDLRALPSVSQVVTLECISNRLGGDLISTGIFTGVPLKILLARVGRRPEGRAVLLQSADQYFESVAPEDVDDDRTLLVWAMDGAPLAAEHGFPLRIYIPNRFGMRQPKWITHLEVVDEVRPGYWELRGWNREAIVQTTSVIDTVGMSMMLGQTETLPVGGIAYSGARGISRVEVQVDNGPWVAAQLRVPPLSPLSWVQWRYDWPYVAGRHEFRVRAYDRAGKLQPIQSRSPHPDGATGIHELVAHV